MDVEYAKSISTGHCRDSTTTSTQFVTSENPAPHHAICLSIVATMV